MAKDLVQDVWPHAAALVRIRKNAGRLSVERAAARIGASRASWVAWEAGRTRPGYEYLKAIVEAFDVPPESIGFEAPEGWSLVPEAWLQEQFDAFEERQKRRDADLLAELVKIRKKIR